MPETRQHLPGTGGLAPPRPGGRQPQSPGNPPPYRPGTEVAFKGSPAEDRQMNPLWDAVMETPTYIALSRQMVLQAQMDVVANNIANANTQGFKAEMLLMSEVDLPAE